MRLLGWRGTGERGGPQGWRITQIPSSLGEGRASVELGQRGPVGGQTWDNLIWGGFGWAQGKAFKNMGTSSVGSLDTPSHFQLRLQIVAAD